MHRKESSELNPAAMAVIAGVLATVAVLSLLLIEWPLLLWSALHGQPELMAPAIAIGSGFGMLFTQEAAPAWAAYEMPPLSFAIVANAVLGFGFACLASVVWLRVDRWRGQSHTHTRSWSLRRRVAPRAWAKPRDWLHLQPIEGSRSSATRQTVNRQLRVVLGERRAPDAIDSWLIGRLHGAEVRSGREMHAGVFGATRSGKSIRVLMAQVRAHRGPAVVMSNKLDVVFHSIMLRGLRGPVWVYAPFSDLMSLRVRHAAWTPLTVCGSWRGALDMAGWLYDADPTAAQASAGSGGARFYNREAVEALLPALLHAASLGERSMSDVLGWLRGGADALDEPRDILSDHDADRAALALAGVQQLDERPRSLLLMSAAQLVSAYRHPDVQFCDHRDIDPGRLLDEHGTLYLIAPESQQDVLAPLFGGILGEVLRTCEQRAQHAEDPRRLPLLKLIVDEAAHLAPLQKLPTLLAVSAGWGCRWMLCYQSVAQVRRRYGTDADSILANLGVRFVLGPVRDHATREEFVKLLGEEEITRTSHTSDAWGGSRSTTRAPESKAKIGTDDLGRLREGAAIVVHGRDLPAVVHVPLFWEWEDAHSPEQLRLRDERNSQQRGADRP